MTAAPDAARARLAEIDAAHAERTAPLRAALERLARLGLALSDVERAIDEAPAGRRAQIQANRRSLEAEEAETLAVLADLAREAEELALLIAEMERLGKVGVYEAFRSTIEPDRWYVGRGKVAIFATEIGASGELEARLAAACLNAGAALSRQAVPPIEWQSDCLRTRLAKAAQDICGSPLEEAAPISALLSEAAATLSRQEGEGANG